MKELQYLNKYFIKYKYRFLLGVFITIIAQIFSLFTPKLISKSFESIERYSKSNVADTLLIRNELFHNVIII
jgi:ATP-binding cassette subfamily B protein